MIESRKLVGIIFLRLFKIIVLVTISILSIGAIYLLMSFAFNIQSEAIKIIFSPLFAIYPIYFLYPWGGNFLNSFAGFPIIQDRKPARKKKDNSMLGINTDNIVYRTYQEDNDLR